MEESMQDERMLIHRELPSDRPFEAVVAAFEAAVGTMDGDAFRDAVASAADADDFEARMRAAEGPSGFMSFMLLDHGAWMGRMGRSARVRLYIVGNPLIAWTMLQHDLRAGLHVPVRVLIFEDEGGGCRLAYDLPSSLMAPLGDERVTAAARHLDDRLAALVESVIAA
jgi:uncharacterized protein (DUF302 family)